MNKTIKVLLIVFLSLAIIIMGAFSVKYVVKQIKEKQAQEKLLDRAAKSAADQAAKNASTLMLAEIDMSLWDDMIIVYSYGSRYYEYKLVDGVFTERANAKNNKTKIETGATVYTQTGEPLTGVQTQANATGVTYVEVGAIARNIAVIVNP